MNGLVRLGFELILMVACINMLMYIVMKEQNTSELTCPKPLPPPVCPVLECPEPPSPPQEPSPCPDCSESCPEPLPPPSCPVSECPEPPSPPPCPQCPPPCPPPSLPHISAAHFDHIDPTTRNLQPVSSIAIVTAYLRSPTASQRVDYDTLFQMHLERSIRYAHYHSYAHFVENSDFLEPNRKPHWAKLPAIWNHLHYYEWILWIDVDALICNFTITLEEILERARQEYDIDGNGKDFIIAQDMNGLNSGVFLLRNTTWSRDFLERAYNVPNQAAMEYEQDALKQLLRENADDLDHVQYIPQRWFNSYPGMILDMYRLTGAKRASMEYHGGDFVLHLPGLSVPDKLKVARQLIPPAIPDVNITPGQRFQWELAVQPFEVDP